MAKKRKTLLLLDGHALIHRAYHALPPLTTKDGTVVNAVYGFSSTLLSVLKKFQPDYIIASFDLPGPTFRHKLSKDYKATRKKAPDDLYAQIPLVKELTADFGVQIFEKEGFEADDVIGTLARLAEEEDINVIIATGDQDALQLVSDHVQVFTMRRGINDTVIYDRAAVIEKFSLTPEQLIDYKGLRGDSSDNIHGVKGIGEKTATTLLTEHKTLEDVYEHLDDLKPAVREKLERDRVQAFQSKELGTIVRDVDLGDVDFTRCVTDNLNYVKLATAFKEFNFYSLVKRLPEGVSVPDKRSKATHLSDGVKDFKYVLHGEKDFSAQLKEIMASAEVACSFFLADDGALVGVALSHKTGRAVYVPWDMKHETHSMKQATGDTHSQVDFLKKFFGEKKVTKIFFDAKEAMHVLKRAGIDFCGNFHDVLLQVYVLDPGRKIAFDDLVVENFDEDLDAGKEESAQLTMDLSSEKEKAQELCARADYTFKLFMQFQSEIKAVAKTQSKNASIATLLATVEEPLVPILASMEDNGIMLNTVVFEGITQTLAKKLATLEKAIHKHAGEKFNINSTQQLRHILFTVLKISTVGIKKTKTGFSTAAAELEKIKDVHLIVAKIEEYRELFKLKTTYLDPLPEYVDENSRIHTHFNQAVTATGRLSSSDPNLQNIPIRTDLGKLLRTAFVPEDGYVFVSADYSQIDLRCVAHVARDKKMIAAFKRGEDIHEATAAEINGVTPAKVTKVMRRNAKALNFGLIYGMGSFGFAQSAGIEQKEAKMFIDAYMKKFAGVAAYMQAMRVFAKEHGYVETELGRRRTIPEINAANFQVVAAAERMAINMPIQGLTADIMKLAMIEVARSMEHGTRNMKHDDVKMVLQVHDEIIFEVREERAEEIAKKAKEVMEGVYKLRVPLVVDTKIGRSWGEL